MSLLPEVESALLDAIRRDQRSRARTRALLHVLRQVRRDDGRGPARGGRGSAARTAFTDSVARHDVLRTATRSCGLFAVVADRCSCQLGHHVAGGGILRGLRRSSSPTDDARPHTPFN
jgi:hypothetical protein